MSTERRAAEVVVRGLAVANAVGMFIVLVMGAAVTNTGSAEGCGRSWPLCNGQFVPEFTVSTAIEYSHRAVTGLESALVVAVVAVLLVRWRQQSEALALAALMLGSLLLQAGLGAAAVLWPQTPLVLATHFGVSLIAFASTVLGAVFIVERTRPPARAPAQAHLLPSGFRRLVAGVGVYLLLVVYLGAYVRHAGLSLACTDWPLCNGQLIPNLSGPSGVVFAHRLAAAGAVLLLGWLALRCRAHGYLSGMALLAFGLGLLQALSGALLVWTLLGLFSTLLHAGIMALLFGSYAVLVRGVVVRPRTPVRVVPATRPRTAALT